MSPAWGSSSGNERLEGASHLANINGTAQFSYNLHETHDGALVLMSDGYDA